MPFDPSPAPEARTFRAAQLHGRIGSACAGMLLSFVLIVSICAIALMLGTSAASATVRNLVMVDDGISMTAIFTVVGVFILFLLLAPVALNGLTPSHVRRRRARR